MKTITLSDGEITRVSDEDWLWLAGYNWSLARGYVRRAKPKKAGGKQGIIYMHLEIAKRMGLTGDEVDHRDRDKLNNQRENLRPASGSQNKANREARNVRLKGSRWQAYGKDASGRQVSLGYYDQEEEALRVALDFKIKRFGEYA